MASLLQNPEFESVNTLQLKEDGSKIEIQRPNTWSKPWNLSKKDLNTYLHEYFEKSARPNPTECFEYIATEKSKNLVSKDFSFSYIPHK
jgi:hypothetical protein